MEQEPTKKQTAIAADDEPAARNRRPCDIYARSSRARGAKATRDNWPTASML